MCHVAYPRGEVGVRELRQHLSVYPRRVKAGEALGVRERGNRIAVLAPAGARLTALERLVGAGRATLPGGDVLDLGPPLGRWPSRRASRVLGRLRNEDR
jgi:antitoxin (DNA-binding transcriptional repressor) of toxin-antitoxin stability system